ncbi:MAG: tripartite-type tricarboxylate transporter receptor subunit TctC [Alphaproteobacteria bacterium]|jgi:tripartite-type tricarboxylate transporter receptor subunit TctC
MSKKLFATCFIATGLIALGVLTLPGVASADDFYKNKKIKLIVGLRASSTYSAYARTLSRNMGQYIPGKPGFIVQNMPGAGSLKSYNYLYNVAKRDGSEFGTGHRFVPIMTLFKIKGARFDGSKYSYIGSINKEVGVALAWHTAGFKSLKDVLNRELIVGTSGGGSQLTNFTSVLKTALGAKFRVITGYRGTRAINLAMERGEIQGRAGVSYGSLKNSKPGWLRDKKVHIFMQMGLSRHPELPKIPNILDVLKTDLDRKAVRLLLGPSEMGRPYVAPPGIPAGRLVALRAAFTSTMSDPKFKAEAAKLRLAIDPMSGAEVASLMNRLYKDSPKAVVERAKELTAAGFDVDLRKGKKKKKKKKKK